MPITFKQALDRIGVTVPSHLEEDAEVPVLTGVQRQGDLLIVPVEPALKSSRPSLASANLHWDFVENKGVQVVTGEATGNTHWLHNGFDSRAAWMRANSFDQPVLGWVRVLPGQSALLIHTDEHGANAIGEGTYEIRQRRQVSSSGAVLRSGD